MRGPAGFLGWRDAGLIIGIVVLTLVTFLPALGNGFQIYWDDQENFLTNPAYRGLGWSQLVWMWTTFHMGHYIPLTWMSLGLDYALWGMDPFGYHLTSLLLHAGNAGLFYLGALVLLGAATPARTEGDGPRLRFGAAFAALVFALHPLRVESVAWVTERRDVVSAFFYLLSVLAYLRAHAATGGRAISRGTWYWVALAGFAMALLSKSISVSLPVILLVLDIYPLRRLPASPRYWMQPGARAVLLEKIPFVCLAGSASIMAFAALERGGTLTSLRILGPAERVAVALHGIAFYLWKTVVPIGLSPLYEIRLPLNPLGRPFLASAALALGLCTAAIALRRRWPALGAVWVSYVVMLLPVLGIFQNGPQLAADRYTYLACLGWALLAGGGLARWWRPHSGHLALAARVAPAAALTVVAALALLTFQQTRVWRDSATLWSHALAVDPSSSTAAKNVGKALLALGKVSEAHRYFDRMAREAPSANRLFGFAWALDDSGDFETAARYYRDALALTPDHARAWNNLGVIHARRGEFREALDAFLRSLRSDPGLQAACVNGLRVARSLGISHSELDNCARHPP